MTDLPYLSASVSHNMRMVTVCLGDETEVWLIESIYFGLFGPYSSARVTLQAILYLQFQDLQSAEELSDASERSIYVEHDCGSGVLVLVVCENDLPLFYILVVDGAIASTPRFSPEELKKEGSRMAAKRAARSKLPPHQSTQQASNATPRNRGTVP